ncbi:unnamed protein product [Rhizoctonia solani]|uniref:Aldehyde dehydrogenase domain-containing protein n=1 Tax=Rhizoctonia solani TaxID=456999 RepID=A0A8H3BMQ9_9AGAM|nr:unnamed protein product [Rhizoctonia solani]
MASIIEAHAGHYKELLTSEQGKPHREATFEIMGAAHWFREISYLRLPETVHEDTPERRVVTQHVPLGVTAAIVPWNFPVLLAIAFTGSIETGKLIMQNASHDLKRITLELGGNDPMIILPSVNPEAIAPNVFWGAFTNNGQFCIAAKRIYIHNSVYEPVRDALVAYARTVVVGDGAQESTQIGPVQNIQLFNKLRDLFEDTKARKYKLALGGDFPPTNTDQACGLFVPITIVDNPPEDSRVVQEEQFGPILPLLRWQEEADVCNYTDATGYGLGASVWGSDLTQATRIASQIESGNVWVNEIHKFGPTIPGGGHKQSGIGVENGVAGLKEWTNYQTISINRA